MRNQMIQRLLTAKADLASSRLDRREQAVDTAAGDVLLAIEHVALTTNNVTYAAFGEAM